MIAPAQPQVDALEQHDAWRSVWQVIVNDVLIVALCVVLALIGVASLVLPQSPAAGVADPVAYSQWQTTAQALASQFYTVFETLGLFNLAQALWVRVLMWVLAGLLLARSLDRVFRLVTARRGANQLQDETRLRVTDHAAPLSQLASDLRARRYRVVMPPDEDWLRADRTPWAELLSLTLHLGLLLMLVGAMLNNFQGWTISRQPINSSTPAVLPDGSAAVDLIAVSRPENSAVVRLGPDGGPVTLRIGAGGPVPALSGNLVSCCLSLQLSELTSEYLVKARHTDGAPLTITLSSYASPAAEALLTFRPGETERSFAIGGTNMGVIVSSRGDGDRVRVFTIPNGQVLTDAVIQPSLVISATALEFSPRDGAVIAARYQPGLPLVWLGAALTLVGLAGTALYPAQYLLIRRHEPWTEFYAAGRRTRERVRAMSAPRES